MGKHINFEVENFDVIGENPDSQFATAKVRAFSSGENRHSMTCEESVLQATAPSIFNKPILYSFSKLFQDFGTHTEPDEALIAGFVVPDSAEFERLPDNRLSLSVLIKLWKRYAPKVIEILKDGGAKKAVSVEMDLLDSSEREDGLIEMKNFIYSGICLLGDLVQPASPGAQLQMVSFAKEQEEYNKAYKKEFALRYDDIDFTIPQEIKLNIEKGLQLYKEHNKGGTSVSLALARHLSKSEKGLPDKIRHMAKTHRGNKFINIKKSPPSDDYIAFMLYGGSEGKEWSIGIANRMEEYDSKSLSYFGETVTFPYTSLKDANPALKGIDPPISLEQANAIARQADAIGSDSEKSGWAIAISSFKKTHVVEKGKWVKKEKMSEAENSNVKEKINMEDEEKKTEEMALEEEKKEESPEEEKKETPAEEKQEEEKEEKKEMSLDANLDIAAILAMLADETEGYKEVVEAEFAKPEGEKNFAKVCEVMFAKMCKMSVKMAEKDEQNKAYMSEIEELKKFKFGIETQQFNFEVESTLKEVEGAVEMPKSEIDQLREDSKNFSLMTVDAWKNAVKARAFTFASKGKKETTEDKRYGLPWGIVENKKKNLWD